MDLREHENTGGVFDGNFQAIFNWTACGELHFDEEDNVVYFLVVGLLSLV